MVIVQEPKQAGDGELSVLILNPRDIFFHNVLQYFWGEMYLKMDLLSKAAVIITLHCGMNKCPHRKVHMQSISFIRVPANKDCYKHSFLQKTTAEWNLLPAAVRGAPSPDAFQKSLHNLNLLNQK